MDKLTSCEIYEMNREGKMVKISVPENAGKNSLPLGTVLKLEGYDGHKSVIVKNQYEFVNESEPAEVMA